MQWCRFPSFIFSKYLTLVTIVVDPELILGTMGMRREYNLDRTTVHLKAPCAYIHTMGGVTLYFLENLEGKTHVNK